MAVPGSLDWIEIKKVFSSTETFQIASIVQFFRLIKFQSVELNQRKRSSYRQMYCYLRCFTIFSFHLSVHCYIPFRRWIFFGFGFSVHRVTCTIWYMRRISTHRLIHFYLYLWLLSMLSLDIGYWILEAKHENYLYYEIVL